MKEGLFFLILTLSICFSSCDNGTSPRKLADDYCDCIKGGISLDMNMFSDDYDDIIQNMNDKDRQKLLETTIRFRDAIKQKRGEQRKRFLKDFLKALLDTDCADMAFGFIPYEEIIRNLDKSIKWMERDSGK